MLELKRDLAARLDALHVHVDVLDRDTLVLTDVPIARRFFNHDRTNLLFKRPSLALPFVVGVNEDLCYTGPDRGLARAFATATIKDGWRLITPMALERNLQSAVDSALTMLGFDGREPSLAAPGFSASMSAPRGLLETCGTNLLESGSSSARAVVSLPTVGREDEVQEVCGTLLRWGASRLCVIVGESGVGKTNLLHGVARRLQECRRPRQVLSVDLAQLFAGTLFEAEREKLLSQLLEEARVAPDTVLAVENLDLALPARGMLLLTQAIDGGLAVVGTLLPDGLERLQFAPLARRLHVVNLQELNPRSTLELLQTAAERLTAFHELEIPGECLPACVRISEPLAGVLPAKALAVLDAAAATAALGGAQVLGLDDLYHAASRMEPGGD